MERWNLADYDDDDHRQRFYLHQPHSDQDEKDEEDDDDQVGEIMITT